MIKIALPKIFFRRKNKNLNNIKEKNEQKNKSTNEFKIYKFNGQVKTKENLNNNKKFEIGLAMVKSRK